MHGDLKHAGHLFRLRNKFAIVAALCEEMFRMGLLEVSASYFIARDLRCDGENRYSAAVTVVEPVDQVQISGTATSSTNCQLSGEMGFRTRRKRCRFFMAQMDPLQFSGCSNRVGDAVERITRNSKNPPNSSFGQNIHQQVRYSFLRHDVLLFQKMMRDFASVRLRDSDANSLRSERRAGYEPMPR